ADCGLRIAEKYWIYNPQSAIRNPQSPMLVNAAECRADRGGDKRYVSPDRRMRAGRLRCEKLDAGGIVRGGVWPQADPDPLGASESFALDGCEMPPGNAASGKKPPWLDENATADPNPSRSANPRGYGFPLSPRFG